MSSALEVIIEILENQKWHSVVELAKAVGRPEEAVEVFLRFLAKYGFAEYDEEERRVIISPDLKKLLKE